MILLPRERRTNHTRDKCEIGGETIVESVHHISEKPARFSTVPRLALLSRNPSQRRRVLRRFLRQRGSFATAGRTSRRRAMHVEVRLYFASLFLEQHRQKKTRPEQFAHPRKKPGPTTR